MVAPRPDEDSMERIHTLGPADLAYFDAMLTLFSAAFEAPDHYSSRRPDAAYVQRLLARDTFIALVALDGDAVVGALAAY
jgi:aminoglycoside 3-N-acetyltransferase I